MTNPTNTPVLIVDREFKNLIPPLLSTEREGLERSILSEGVRDAVVVWDGTIVDGHNRYEIARGNNADGEVLEFSVVERDFKDRQAAKVWIIENQLEHRRNLSDADKIDLAETKREIIEASQSIGGRPAVTQQDTDLFGQEPPQNFGEVSRKDRETDSQVGKAAGVSRETVRKYREIKRQGDERLVEGLRDKSFSMDNAYHLSRVSEGFPETYAALWELEGDAAQVRYSTPQLKHLASMPDDETARDLVELVEGGNAKSVQEAHKFRKAERQKAKLEELKARGRELAENPVEFPVGEFTVLEADPPWSMRSQQKKSQHYQYATQELDDIKAMGPQIREVSAENAHLYLWAINPMLREAFEVMEAWGFEYKTLITWRKPHFGTGDYFRGQTEHVLFGIRGKLPTLANDIANVFDAPKGRHSEKPESFYDLIEKASPGPYLRLYARSERPGWWSWGDETSQEAV